MKKYLVISNPAAGRGRAVSVRLKVLELLRSKGVAFDLELTTGPKQATGIARKAVAAYDVIVALGGDGTVNEVAQGMLFSGKQLGIIPTGSGNDFIKALGIPNSIEAAVDILLKGDARVIDAGKINDSYFVNGVGIGFDAAVNQAGYEIDHSRRGLWLYVGALMRTLGKFQPVPVTISLNKETFRQNIFLLTVGNGTTCGGGFKLTPHAKIDDQLLDVTIVSPLGIPTLLWHLPKVFLGTIDRVRHARLLRTSRIVVQSPGPIPVHLDGEVYAGPFDELVIEVVPRALAVIGRFSSEPLRQ